MGCASNIEIASKPYALTLNFNTKSRLNGNKPVPNMSVKKKSYSLVKKYDILSNNKIKLFKKVVNTHLWGTSLLWTNWTTATLCK